MRLGLDWTCHAHREVEASHRGSSSRPAARLDASETFCLSENCASLDSTTFRSRSRASAHSPANLKLHARLSHECFLSCVSMLWLGRQLKYPKHRANHNLVCLRSCPRLWSSTRCKRLTCLAAVPRICEQSPCCIECRSLSTAGHRPFGALPKRLEDKAKSSSSLAQALQLPSNAEYVYLTRH